MCGICGIWHVDGQSINSAAVHDATVRLRHRGPDDEGYLLVDTASGCQETRRGPDTSAELLMPEINESNQQAYNLAFGFRRLSILDISPAGHQPMSNADGSLWLIFNGEIYNYLELRAELQAKGYTFRTATDTEVILAAYDAWGEACLERFNGMWAFALWDNRQRRLFCARDRFGIKPFYYFWDRNTFAFASEIKALLLLTGLKPRANEPIIFDYLSSANLDHTPETFFADIYQLPPAHYLILQNNQLHLQRYWHIPLSHPAAEIADDTGYAQKFYELFEDAVRLHLRSDVAIGTCLSGGLDSSAIVYVANKLLFADQVINLDLVGQQQKTFSSCFEDKRFDERQYIQYVLTETGAEPNFTFPSPVGLLEDLSRLIWHQDEPFGSTSIYAQWCVMKLVAERGVKVLLDGQGGDEMLAGYHPYFNYYWGALAKQGHWTELWNEWQDYRAIYGTSTFELLIRTMRPHVPTTLLNWRRQLRRGNSLGLNLDFIKAHLHRVYQTPDYGGDLFHNFLYHGLTRISLPGLLHYEDRNSMAHSVEARVPFLDYRLVEYVFSLPANQKIKHGLTKAVMRNALKGVLPEAIRTRTDKMGFVTPERVWLTTALNDWLYDLVDSQSFRERGYFDVDQIRQVLKEHQQGSRDLTFLAWRWINLELWLRQMIDIDPVSGT